MEFAKSPEGDDIKNQFNLAEYLNDHSTLEHRFEISSVLKQAINPRKKLSSFPKQWNKYIAFNIYVKTHEYLDYYHNQLLHLNATNQLIYPSRKSRQKPNFSLDNIDKDLIDGVHGASILIFDVMHDYDLYDSLPRLPIPADLMKELNQLINTECGQRLQIYRDNNKVYSPHLNNQRNITANNIYKFSVETIANRLEY